MLALRGEIEVGLTTKIREKIVIDDLRVLSRPAFTGMILYDFFGEVVKFHT